MRIGLYLFFGITARKATSLMHKTTWPSPSYHNTVTTLKTSVKDSSMSQDDRESILVLAFSFTSTDDQYSKQEVATLICVANLYGIFGFWLLQIPIHALSKILILVSLCTSALWWRLKARSHYSHLRGKRIPLVLANCYMIWRPWNHSGLTEWFAKKIASLSSLLIL